MHNNRDLLWRMPAHLPYVATRRGFTITETVAAMAVVAGLISMVGQGLIATGGFQRECQRRQLASVLAENALEELRTLPYEQISRESAAALRLPPDLVKALPGAELLVEVRQVDQPAPGKQISLRLTWLGSQGQPAAPIQLAAWVFFSPTEQTAAAQTSTGTALSDALTATPGTEVNQ